MKKKKLILFSSLFLTGMVLTVQPIHVSAKNVEKNLVSEGKKTHLREAVTFFADNFEYAVIQDENKADSTKVRLQSYVLNSLSEVVEIPEKVTDTTTGKEYIVTEIDSKALAYDQQSNEAGEIDNVRKIILPDTIVRIERRAFQGRSLLETIYLGKNLEFMSGAVFEGAASLKTINLPSTLKIIGNLVFTDSGIESVVFPESMTGDSVEFVNTFSEAKNLSSVTLPKNLDRISYMAFNGTTALTTLDIPDSVSSIEASAFARSGLTSVRLPKGITSSNTVIGSGNGLDEEAFYTDTIEKIIFTSPISGDFKFSNGREFKVFKEPVKEGYTFDGWQGDNGVVYQHDELTPKVANMGNITVTARWKSNSSNADTDTGLADANIKLLEKQPTGSLSFGNIATDARMSFADVTLNGLEQRPAETTNAKVIVTDTRSNKAKGWEVTAKYIDSNFVTNGLNLIVNPISADTDDLKAAPLSQSDQLFFTDGGAGKEKYDIQLKPELTIPAKFTETGEQKTEIQWTLSREV